MLADLGLSHFSAVTQGDGHTRDGNGGSQAYCRTTSSHIHNDLLTVAASPERNLARFSSVDYRPKVMQNIDIWSLGCVYCEFHAWTVDGLRGLHGVQRYRMARMNDERAHRDLGACFHAKDGALLPTVEEWHTAPEFLDLCAKKDFVTPVLWVELLSHMLTPHTVRMSSSTVLFHGQKIIDTARRRLDDLSITTDRRSRAGTRDSFHLPRTPPQQPPGFPRSSEILQPVSNNGRRRDTAAFAQEDFLSVPDLQGWERRMRKQIRDGGLLSAPPEIPIPSENEERLGELRRRDHVCIVTRLIVYSLKFGRFSSSMMEPA
jgi:hypothetical protein